MFQDLIIDEVKDIFDRLENIDAQLKISIDAYAKVAAERALLAGLNSIIKPARTEIASMVEDTAFARAQLRIDVLAFRKELLSNDLDQEHEPQPEMNMAPFYWASAAFIFGVLLGGYAIWILRS